MSRMLRDTCRKILACASSSSALAPILKTRTQSDETRAERRDKTSQVLLQNGLQAL
ncbi:hypothetical protein Mapa_010897 [Marchantia paleacea]|nr:hypothetical protein Mapa_010897 [Marchantia paleacea]